MDQIDPQTLAYYQAQFPGRLAMGMGNAPTGTNTGAGSANALSKLVLALMQAKAMKNYQQRYPQQQPTSSQQPPPMAQGQTLAAPGGLGASIPGGVGVPDL